jgi:hypothetical protein
MKRSLKFHNKEPRPKTLKGLRSSSLSISRSKGKNLPPEIRQEEPAPEATLEEVITPI